MANHTTSQPTASSDLARLAWFIGISVGIHLVILVATSLPYIMRGFRPAGAPAAATAPSAATAPASAGTPEAAGKPASDAKAAPDEAAAPVKPTAGKTPAASKTPAAGKTPAPGKTPAAGKGAADPDSDYFKDDKLTPADLRKGPALDTGLDAK